MRACLVVVLLTNFEKINYTLKHNPKMTIDEIKQKTSKFTNVIDHQECFVIKYNLIKKDN